MQLANSPNVPEGAVYFSFSFPHLPVTRTAPTAPAALRMILSTVGFLHNNTYILVGIWRDNRLHPLTLMQLRLNYAVKHEEFKQKITLILSAKASVYVCASEFFHLYEQRRDKQMKQAKGCKKIGKVAKLG